MTEGTLNSSTEIPKGEIYSKLKQSRNEVTESQTKELFHDTEHAKE